VTVKRTLIAEPSNIRVWNTYLSGLFFARTFSTGLLGGTTEPSGTIYYTASAGIVCLKIPELTATSSETFAFLSGLPNEITPQRDQTCLARVVNNGTTQMGLIQIGTDTGITLFADVNGGAFTASGTKGVKGCNVVYSLD
jgi:hypothetical protein